MTTMPSDPALNPTKKDRTPRTPTPRASVIGGDMPGWRTTAQALSSSEAFLELCATKQLSTLPASLRISTTLTILFLAPGEA